jgi:hypothetical protein
MKDLRSQRIYVVQLGWDVQGGCNKCTPDFDRAIRYFTSCK